MKKIRLAAFTACSVLLMQVTVYAGTTGNSTESFGILDGLRFFGMFFLVMAAIFAALMFTNWIGKQKEKHKK